FVVLLSALLQGSALPYVARRLRLELPAKAVAPVSLEITSLKDVDGDIVEDYLVEDSRAVGRSIRELGLPDGIVVAMVARGERIIPPKGSTVLHAGDHVFVVLRPHLRPLVDRVFAAGTEPPESIVALGELPLRGSARVMDLNEFYGIDL